MLFSHFTDTTIQIFDDNQEVQQEIRSMIIPMAVDTNHGFSLLAAILSLASTHRKNLGLHESCAEVIYWKDMSVGHLRRPGVQEDGSTENVFAATALMLCVRDAISQVGCQGAWKLHLLGAFTVLEKSSGQMSPTEQATKSALKRLAKSLQLRSPLPVASSPSTAPECSDRNQETTSLDVYGISAALGAVLQTIRGLRLEKFALHNIERNSDSSNMAPLWSSLRGKCLELICSIREFTDPDSSKDPQLSNLDRLYAFAALIQIYYGVLQISLTDAGLRTTMNSTLALLKDMGSQKGDKLSVLLVFPLLTVGCLVQSHKDRKLVKHLLARIRSEHGKFNATFVQELLEEIWNQADENDKEVRQIDVDRLMGKSFRMERYC